MPHPATHTLPVLTAGAVVVVAGILLAQYFGRRGRGAGGWLVADRSLPLFVVVITQFATAVGGGVLIAHVGIAYRSGWAVFVYEGLVLLGFCGLALIGRWLRRHDFATVPDILRRLFGTSRPMTLLGALCSLVVPFGWLATQFVAFGRLLSQITGLSMVVLVLVAAAASLLFVLPGGLMSVAWTDFVFGLVKITLAVVVALYAVHLAGGWGTITRTVPARLWQPGALGGAGWKTELLWVFAVLPGTLTNQMYYQRLFATKRLRDARRGLVLSGVVTMVAGVYAGLIGLSVRAMNPGLGAAGSENAAGWLLTRLPVGLLAVFAAFLVATIISTTGSALQSVVASLVNDVYLGTRRDRPGDRRLLVVSRLLTAAVTVAAVVLSIAFPQALGWLVATYAYSAGSLAVPIFAGYLLHRRYRLGPAAGLGAMVCGLAGCAVAQVVGTTVPYVAYGLAASLVWLLVATAVAGRRTGPAPAPSGTPTAAPSGSGAPTGTNAET